MVAGLLLVGVAGWIWWQGPSTLPDPARRSAGERPGAVSPGLPSWEFGEAEAAAAASRAREDADGDPADKAYLPAGALAGQRLWRSGDPDALAAAARSAGFEVLGISGALGLVHVAGAEADLRAWGRDDLEEDFVYRTALPAYPSPEAITLEGLEGFATRALASIGVLEVPAEWGNGVRLALLDTGLTNHPALRDARLSGAPANSLNGHGTAVASMIVGNDPYAQGLAPGVDLINFPVLNAEGQGDTFGLAMGILQALEAGADIISISAGSLGDSWALREAVALAAARGVSIVASTGNDGLGVLRYPAADPNVLAVTSIDAQGRPPSFANQGDGIAVAAPGVGVYTAWIDEGYVSMSGSSVAAPLLSATIAVVQSQFPTWTTAEAQAHVLAHLNDLGPPGHDAVYGGGTLDVARILRNATGEPVADLAVIPPYVALDQEQDGLVPIYLSVQNQGTVPLDAVRLEMTVGGIPYAQALGSLAAGVSHGVQVRVAVSDLRSAGGVVIETKGVLPDAVTDVKAENDALTATLRLRPPPEE